VVSSRNELRRESRGRNRLKVRAALKGAGGAYD
jgi:hypothetical protein